MAFGRKRVYATAFKSNFKRNVRRKFKRRYKKTGKSTSYSTKSGGASGFGFKSKRVSRRRWNSMLWNSTLQKQHYRSVGAAAGSLTTPSSRTQVSNVSAQAMDNGVSVFWVQAGGAIGVNGSLNVPLFEDDIIVRGGIVGIKIANLATAVAGTERPVSVKIWLIRQAPRPTAAQIPATATLGWDPSTVPEFTRDYGRIIYKREFQLEPAAEMTIERRIGIMKIDQESWSTDAQRLTWLISATDSATTDQQTVNITTYFNLSFSGDVSTTGV